MDTVHSSVAEPTVPFTSLVNQLDLDIEGAAAADLFFVCEMCNCEVNYSELANHVAGHKAESRTRVSLSSQQENEVDIIPVSVPEAKVEVKNCDNGEKTRGDQNWAVTMEKSDLLLYPNLTFEDKNGVGTVGAVGGKANCPAASLSPGCPAKVPREISMSMAVSMSIPPKKRKIELDPADQMDQEVGHRVVSPPPNFIVHHRGQGQHQKRPNANVSDIPKFFSSPRLELFLRKLLDSGKNPPRRSVIVSHNPSLNTLIEKVPAATSNSRSPTVSPRMSTIAPVNIQGQNFTSPRSRSKYQTDQNCIQINSNVNETTITAISTPSPVRRSSPVSNLEKILTGTYQREQEISGLDLTVRRTDNKTENSNLVGNSSVMIIPNYTSSNLRSNPRSSPNSPNFPGQRQRASSTANAKQIPNGSGSPNENDNDVIFISWNGSKTPGNDPHRHRSNVGSNITPPTQNQRWIPSKAVSPHKQTSLSNNELKFLVQTNMEEYVCDLCFFNRTDKGPIQKFVSMSDLHEHKGRCHATLRGPNHFRPDLQSLAQKDAKKISSL